MLAKKLVAAAAVESSSKLTLLENLNPPQPENLENKEKEVKEVEEDKEENCLKIDEEVCEAEEVNKQQTCQPQRAHSFTCGGSQEQKKVFFFVREGGFN